MQFLDAINIVDLFFYSQKKKEEKLCLGGHTKSCDRRTDKKNREFCVAVKLPKNLN